MELVESHGGQIKRQGNGAVIENFEELQQKPQFQEELSEMMEDYESILDRIQEIDQANFKKQQEKIAEVDFKQIHIDQYPDQMDGGFTESFLEFTTTNS